MPLPAWIPPSTASTRNIPSTTSLPLVFSDDTSTGTTVTLQGTGLDVQCGDSVTYEADNPSIVYRWRVPAAGTYRFSTCDNADFDTQIVVFDANNGGTPQCIAGQDDNGSCTNSLTTEFEADLMACQTVYVAVFGYLDSEGPYTLTISEVV
ncbi:MAG: hypothetical protein MHM6MM_005722 [Cercozoa sp. M6MM]